MSTKSKVMDEIDEFAFSMMVDLDSDRLTGDRDNFYDGYYCGVINFAKKLREKIREIESRRDESSDADQPAQTGYPALRVVAGRARGAR